MRKSSRIRGTAKSVSWVYIINWSLSPSLAVVADLTRSVAVRRASNIAIHPDRLREGIVSGMERAPQAKLAKVAHLVLGIVKTLGTEVNRLVVGDRVCLRSRTVWVPLFDHRKVVSSPARPVRRTGILQLAKRREQSGTVCLHFSLHPLSAPVPNFDDYLW